MRKIKEFQTISYAVILVVLIVSCSQGGKEHANTQAKDSIDLLSNATFVGFSDSLGSTFDTAGPFLNEHVLYVKYSMATLQEDNYPWVDLECYTNDAINWENLDSIKITYKSAVPLELVLSQENLLDNGESYRVKLEQADDWITRVVNISEFKQPIWSISQDVPLDLKKYRSLGVLPVVTNLLKPYSGSFLINNLIAYGLSLNDTLKAKDPSIVFNSINNNKIYFFVKETGVYTFEIKDVNGKLITQFNDTILYVGANDVPLSKPLDNGVYRIKLSNNKTSVEVKSIVNKLPVYYDEKR